MAVCGAIFGRPIVIGFLRANDSQMAFNQADRTVWRHASGTYATAAPDGSLEIHHPGGAYFRIGSGDGHEDLAPISADGNWSLPEASGATIVLETKAKDDNGNAKGFKLVITPSGDATVTTDGKVTMTAEDDVRIESKKKVDIVSGGNMTLSVSGRLVANVTGHAGILLNAGYDIQVHSSHGAILEDAAQIIENGAVVSTR
ncbi:MAG: hypothetical protein GC191_09240 [Azospirillum sp.]|nr:hypothetical protein [Azospirillum sp.]